MKIIFDAPALLIAVTAVFAIAPATHAQIKPMAPERVKIDAPSFKKGKAPASSSAGYVTTATRYRLALQEGVRECEINRRYAFLYAEFRSNNEMADSMRKMFQAQRSSTEKALELVKSLNNSEAPQPIKDSAKKLYTAWSSYIESMIKATSPAQARAVEVGPAASNYHEALSAFELELDLAG